MNAYVIHTMHPISASTFKTDTLGTYVANSPGELARDIYGDSVTVVIRYNNGTWWEVRSSTGRWVASISPA